MKQLSCSKRAFSARIFDIIQVIYKPNQFAKSLKLKASYETLKFFKIVRGPNWCAKVSVFLSKLYRYKTLNDKVIKL